MKNISHTINNATKKLLVAALVLASLSPFSLDAMKRLREDDNKQQEHAKKPKIEKRPSPLPAMTEQNSKYFTS